MKYLRMFVGEYAYKRDRGRIEGEGWSRGVEEGCWRVPRGRCAGPVQTRCSPIGHTQAQVAPQGKAAGVWAPGAPCVVLLGSGRFIR